MEETTRRNSKKRQAIYDALRATKEHPSAEQLYTMVKPDYPDLSLGTIYRNLSVLEQDGLVIDVGQVSGEARYDACMDDHAHFICSKCGAVIDLDLNADSVPAYAVVENSLGSHVDSYSLSYRGLCKNCLK